MSFHKPQSMKTQEEKRPFFVDFNKASKESVKSVIKAMIAEMEEAMALKRFATFEGAFARLSPSTDTVI